MNQTSNNGKKPSLTLNIDPYGPNLGPNQILDIIAGYHCIQFEGKLINET